MGGNWKARARCGIILRLHFAAGLVGWLAGETDGLAVLWGAVGLWDAGNEYMFRNLFGRLWDNCSLNKSGLCYKCSN